MTGLNFFDNTMTVPGKHAPDCESRLGPDFEVTPGQVVMTLHICTGCLPVFDAIDADRH